MSENILDPVKLWVWNIWFLKNNLRPSKKNSGSKKIFGQKNFESKKNFGPENILCWKNVHAKWILGQKV